MKSDTEEKLLNLELYKLLLEKEKKLKAGTKLSTKISEIVRECVPLLERIPENMSEFTLHDPNHGAKVVDIMGKIIPRPVLANLNHIELSLLILSGYLHDMGMTCSKDEKQEILNSEEFKILFRSDVINFHQYQSYRASADMRDAIFIEDQVFTEYLRQHHVKRSAIHIRKMLGSGDFHLTVDGIEFYEHLIAVCNSHGEPVKALNNLDNWPRNTLIGEYIVNIQFISLVLRLADILDLDAERTPRLIYEYINPKNPISIIEWKKHRSILGKNITTEKVLFEAKCTSPEVERALKEFLLWIEIERKESMALLKTYTDEIAKKYFLGLNEEVTNERIKNDGSYIYNDLKFSIDYKRVIELLIGERLYKSPIVAIRELIQNSVDALKMREEIFKNRSESFHPQIKLVLEDDILSIEDNGLGMDLNVFKNFFLQAGNSYYSSKEFYASFFSIDAVSEFGIGVLSVFMIANSLKIESRKEPSDPLQPPHPILFEIPTAYGYTIERKSNRTEIGTKITLTLKDSNVLKQISLYEIVKEIIPSSPYDIQISVKEKNEIIHKLAKYRQFNNLPDILKNNVPNLPRIRRTAGDKDKIFEWLKITFAESTNSVLKDISGSISIVNQQGNEVRTGKICQRSFAIGYPSSTEKNFEIKIPGSLHLLFPQWLCLDIQINLTKTSCLNISPDRTEVIIDEKFRMLQNLIEEEIIKKIRQQFEHKYLVNDALKLVNFQEYLFNANYFSFPYLKEEFALSPIAISFLSDSILFRCLSPEGTFSLNTINEISLCDNVGIVADRWDAIKVKKVQPFLKKFNIHLVTFSEAPIWTDDLMRCLYKIFVGTYFDNMNRRIMINDLLPSLYFNLAKNTTIPIQSASHQFITLKDPEPGIIFIFEDGVWEVQIDKDNKIFDFLPLGARHQKYVQAFTTLEVNVAEVLGEALQKLSEEDYTIRTNVLSNLTRPYYVNFYPFFRKIFITDLMLLNTLNELFELFVDELVEEKLLDMPVQVKITKKYFPSYWSK